MTIRRLRVHVVACLVLGSLLASGASAHSISGVVPDVPTGGHPPAIAHIANLPYNGGPVLHSNRTHVIFWQPGGSGLTFDPGYEALIIKFFHDVADDSHKPTNVYGLSGQYTDSGHRPAAYDSRYGSALVARDALPPPGPRQCVEPVLTGPGWTQCVFDRDIQKEVDHVVSSHHLPITARDIYFVVMPKGLGSCTDDNSSCALGGSGTGYCGYHSETENSILYAVIPYNAVPGHCQSDNPRPNASTADPTLSTISHEHNEVVTDPLGDAWIDATDNEDGDLCITHPGPPVGGSGDGAWNEVIHGRHYFLQEEWSNDDGGCAPRDESDRVSFSAKRTVAARQAERFTARARDPDGRIVAYAWFFGGGAIGRHRVVSHKFAHAGTYRVILRVTDSADNWAFYSRTIRVTAPRRTRH